MSKRVSLKFSPYTFARVAVMKSRLYRKAEYDRLLKMGYNEVLKFLEESGYKKEMDSYDVSSQDITIIEAALSANLLRTFMRLHSIANESTKKVISLYLFKYDMENLKMIIRSKFAGVPETEIEPLLFDSLNYSREFFVNLSKKDRVADIINTFSSLRARKIPMESLFEIENALDTYHLERISEFASSIKGEGKLISQFMKQQLDIVNIRVLLRLAQQERSEYDQYVVAPSKLVKELMTKKTVDDMLAHLEKRKLVEFSQGGNGNKFVETEIALETSVLQNSLKLMHKNLLSANYILGYFLAKEVEVRNLKILVKGKKFDLDPQFIEKTMVIAA